MFKLTLIFIWYSTLCNNHSDVKYLFKVLFEGPSCGFLKVGHYCRLFIDFFYPLSIPPSRKTPGPRGKNPSPPMSFQPIPPPSFLPLFPRGEKIWFSLYNNNNSYRKTVIYIWHNFKIYSLGVIIILILRISCKNCLFVSPSFIFHLFSRPSPTNPPAGIEW